MKEFMDKDFLLDTDTAKELYHKYADGMPIFDFHNHLDAKAIYEDTNYENITELWLGSDHYKWRVLRANGVEEKFITGKESSDYQKFIAWAKTVPDTFNNPLYHWTHLELQRYFNINKVLSSETADDIWNICNEKLANGGFSVRGLLKKMKVKALCTTDDPADDLFYHKALSEGKYDIKVLPTFRPDNAMDINKSSYNEYIKRLSAVAEINIDSYDSLKRALSKRVKYFKSCGCVVSDHSLGGNIYDKADENQLEEIFRRGLNNEKLTEKDISKFKGNLLVFLASEYKKSGWGMQLHVGAIRNNSTRMFEKLGADSGFDSTGDHNYSIQLGELLNNMDLDDNLPKTILYCLNSRDNQMITNMAGNFQQGTTRGKIQIGSAWWFCDHKSGIESQLDALSNGGLLANFVGMVTDSRSFLSFSRHEYFRRVLCNFVGWVVENGEYPKDMAYLGRMIENICYNNVVNYLGTYD